MARFLPDLLEKAALAYPHHTAIDFLDARLSYRHLWQQANTLAASLQAHGLQKGDRVGLMLPNCLAYLQFYFATFLAGGIVVNINPLYAPRELEHILQDSAPKFIVTLNLKQFLEKLSPLVTAQDATVKDAGVKDAAVKVIQVDMRRQLPLLKSLAFRTFKAREMSDAAFPVLHAEEMLEIQTVLRPVDVAVDDIAVLQYTGGTTGVPKAAMLSHANLSINAQQARAHFSMAREGREIFLGVLPFFHAFALTTIVNLSILLGGTIIALPRFDLKSVLKTIDAKKPTIFPAVPTIYTAINHYADLKDYDLTSIDYCISGGAPLPLEVRDAFEKNTGCKLVEGYGLSEASPIVTCNPLSGENKDGSIGIPVLGTTIEIVSLDDKTTPVATGEKGELCVSGPQIMSGYWRNAQETAHVLKNDRLHTGDVAIRDEQGYIYIVDRIKDMILCGGYNVYPRKIEEAVYAHPSVEECVCAGIPDSYRGECPKIWVKLKADAVLSEDDLKNFLREHLSPIEIPKYFEFRDTALPRTLIGKLSRKDLLAQEIVKNKVSDLPI